jgi:hypothetical protein
VEQADTSFAAGSFSDDLLPAVASRGSSDAERPFLSHRPATSRGGWELFGRMLTWATRNSGAPGIGARERDSRRLGRRNRKDSQ